MSAGKDKILDAALALFTARGFHAVSIRDIGERAGLTNPALYQHFRGKQDLGEALYLACYARLIAALEAELTPEMGPMQRLEAYVRVSVKLHAADPSPLPYLEDHQRLFGPRAMEIYGERAISRRLTRWVRDGQAAGDIRSDVPVRFLVGLCIGQLTKWIMMSALDLAPRTEADRYLIDLMHSALAPPSNSNS